MEAKLQNVLLDYGLEGYGLYWYCLELIAGNVEPGNLTFELEHDARMIARNTGSEVKKIQEMMKAFTDLGLFENTDGIITCLKLASSSDDYTAKLVRKTPTNSDKVSLDKNKAEKNSQLAELSNQQKLAESSLKQLEKLEEQQITQANLNKLDQIQQAMDKMDSLAAV